jgi:hypothetical protein
MRRALALIPAFAATLALSAGAQAKGFTVSQAGNHPAIAVDASGTAHVVWDQVDKPDADDATSTTYYCKVPRNATGCAKGSTRTFSPATGDQDFAGPRVFLTGGSNVVVVLTRCCTPETATDGQTYTTRVYSVGSSNNGASFGDPAWIGTTAPDLGGVVSKGAFLALGAADNGVALQSMPVDGFAGAQNLVTNKLADTAGIGASPKGRAIAFNDSTGNVFAASVDGDPATETPSFKSLGKGADVRVGSGPKGVDIMYRTAGKNGRYVVRRVANRKFSAPAAVSEPGEPIFGNLFQDAVGRIHAVWIGDNGVTYRRSGKKGNGFGKPRRVAPLTGSSEFYDLVIAANASGKAAVAYDANTDAGRVAGFTI